MPFKYPYANFHELNLDWIIEKVKEVSDSVKNIPNIVRKEVDSVFESGAIPVNYPPRKILYIGDSYMVGIGEDGDNIPKAVAECIPVSKWWNYAVGGSGFVRDPNNSSYINQIKKAFYELGEEAKEVTDIVVGGNYNDIYYIINGEANSADFFLPHIIAFRDYCTTNFKNAKLHVFPGLYTGANPNENVIKTWQYIRTACKNAGVPHSSHCINWLLGYDESVDHDDVHPSSRGYNIIGRNIAQILNGGSVSTNKKINITNENFTGEISVTFYDDYASYNFNFTPTSAFLSAYEIAKFPDRYCRRAYGNTQIFLMPYGSFSTNDIRNITYSARGLLIKGDAWDTSKLYVGTYIEPMYKSYV